MFKMYERSQERRNEDREVERLQIAVVEDNHCMDTGHVHNTERVLLSVNHRRRKM